MRASPAAVAWVGASGADFGGVRGRRPTIERGGAGIAPGVSRVSYPHVHTRNKMRAMCLCDVSTRPAARASQTTSTIVACVITDGRHRREGPQTRGGDVAEYAALAFDVGRSQAAVSIRADHSAATGAYRGGRRPAGAAAEDPIRVLEDDRSVPIRDPAPNVRTAPL